MRRSVLCVVLLCLGAPPAAAQPALPPTPPEELRYTVFLGNLRPAGLLIDRIESASERVLSVELDDRGRGEKLASRFKLDGAGAPLRLEITGNDYWKNPVDERFEHTGGQAAWSNGSEQGQQKVAGPAYYVSLNGAEHASGLLAAALLRSRHHRLPLLPAGEARIERIGVTRITAKGKALDLTLYAISGLEYAPLYVWMESPRRFFGRYDGFVTVVRQGWEDAAPALLKAQAEAVAARQKSVAQRLSHRPSGPLVVKGVRLFDPQTRLVLPEVTVVVAGNRIQAVGRDGEIPVPAGAQVIEAEGKMLLPGLWDMHQHFTDGDGILDLAAGVTTGRDLGNDSDYLLALKRRWAAGEALGPRVVLAGVIDGPGPYVGPTTVLASTEDEARAIVERYAGLGYEQIKIYNSVDPRLVPAIVAAAHRRGLRLSGHIPYGMTAADAARQGWDEIQHVNFLFLNFLPDVDTRTTARFTAVADHAADLDLGSPPVRAFLQLLKERGVVVDPTVTGFEDRFTARPGKVPPSLAAVADRLPLQLRRTLLGGGLPVPEGKDQRYRDAFRASIAMVHALHAAGIPIVAGTDGPAGFSLHRELENYVQAGIPAPEVLAIATLGAARVMKHDDELGTLAPGKLADMILVDGDPTADISAIRRVVLTVKDGVLYDPAELYREIGVKPAVEPPPRPLMRGAGLGSAAHRPGAR